jgi:transposase-like protein
MKKVKYYSDEFKTKVVNEFLTGQISKEAVRRKYGIGGKTTVSQLICKFEGEKPKRLFMIEKREKTKEQLELEIEQLKHELEYEKLKSEAFDTMIDIAEEQFKISIRKESGAKPSKK